MKKHHRFNKVSWNKETPAELFSCAWNKETSAKVFSYEICKTLKNTFFAEHLQWSRSLFIKKLYIVVVHKKVFEWLVANYYK